MVVKHLDQPLALPDDPPQLLLGLWHEGADALEVALAQGVNRALPSIQLLDRRLEYFACVGPWRLPIVPQAVAHRMEQQSDEEAQCAFLLEERAVHPHQ